MIDAVDQSESSATDQIKAAIMGPEKTGKTNLTATGRKPILHLDYDQRKESIAGRKGIYSITLADPNQPFKSPEAASELLDIQAALEQSLDLHDLVLGGKRVFPNVPKGTIIRSISNDSGKNMARLSLNYSLYNNKDIRKEVNIGGKLSIHVPKTWTAWGADVKYVEDILLRQMALGVDVYFVLHQAAEEAPDSTEENPRFTGKLTVYPVRYSRILSSFNEVWMMVPQVSRDGRPVFKVRTMQNDQFNASTCMLLDPIEEPDIQAMIEKHHRRVAEGWEPPKSAQPQVQSATLAQQALPTGPIKGLKL